MSDDTTSTEVPAHVAELYTKTVTEANLPGDAAEQLKKLLIRHGSVFASPDDDFVHTTLVKHHIDIGDAQKCPPRKQKHCNADGLSRQGPCKQ